ncbi:hypothetical protein CSKR_103707 [Clonorchis sinensis]|uniref:Nucleolar protein 4 helical domain-containing protein n=1 Tax=Clonorchis sinensis TaxID=79923 RepID=A0A8T1MLZ1_CLOSI|nr:hypothetical protein CSKR_103707 [Clonorchis sinensis]
MAHAMYFSYVIYPSFQSYITVADLRFLDIRNTHLDSEQDGRNFPSGHKQTITLERKEFLSDLSIMTEEGFRTGNSDFSTELPFPMTLEVDQPTNTVTGYCQKRIREEMRSNGSTRNDEYQHRGSQPIINSTQVYDCKGGSTKKRRTCDSSDESASIGSMEALSHQTVEPDDSSEEASSHKRTNPPSDKTQAHFGRKGSTQNNCSCCLLLQHSSGMDDKDNSNSRDTPPLNGQFSVNNVRILHDNHCKLVPNKKSGNPGERKNHNDQHDGLDGKDKGTTLGSELLTAAYNSFVRRIVDDTLDRTITFCEQPRQAIIALEHICAKAWPQLELKRHRNRIRAYLKACRRNSKKNKGQINMKEPPMNGLSIEARHLVANALSLVSEEVNKLKRKIHSEHAKNLTLRKPSISPLKNNYTLPDAQESHFNTNSLAPKDISVNSVKSQTESPYTCGENVEPDIFSTNRYDINLLCKPMPACSHSGSNINSTCKNDATLTGIGTTSNLFPAPSSYDNMYMAAMLRLLPSVLQHPLAVNNPNDKQPSLYTKSTLSSDRLVKGKLMNGSPISAWNTSHGYIEEKLTNDFGNHPCSSDLALNRDRANAYLGLPYEDDVCKPFSRFSINYFTEDLGSSMPAPEAPPAHINAIQYSFSLNEAVQKLTDVRILTKDDVIYFLHNLEVAKEAVKYAKGVSRLIMKKAEQLERHINEANSGTRTCPLNLS